MKTPEFAAGAFVLATALGVIGLSLPAGTEARQAATTRERRLGPAPIAITMRQRMEAVVLQADGAAYAVNLATGDIGELLYRVPPAYLAADVAAGAVDGKAVTCFSLSAKTSWEAGAFVLQLMPDRREVWTWMQSPGVYIGVAFNPADGLIYVSNSTTNEVFAVPVGAEKAPMDRVASPARAVRLGVMAIDPAGRRLYVADLGAPVIFAIDLASRAVRRLNVPVGDVRAMAWGEAAHRLYVADSGREAVWVIDPNAPKPATDRFVQDSRIRVPAGITVAPDRSVWIADEAAHALFQVSADSRTVVRVVPWSVGLSMR
jgi:DNA-binding beta-propeller fold protein YncE